jgi:signal transduction histidine kinase
MGTRTLEARLTRRLLALAGLVLVALGCAAVVVIDRVLDAGDTAAASAEAATDVASIERELSEGDRPDEALGEVVAAAEGRGVRLVARVAGSTRSTTDAQMLGTLAVGTCETILDESSRPWRACAAARGDSVAIAALFVGGHRAAVSVLARAVAAAVLVGLFALWLAVRQALRAPIEELTSLVGWTGRIVDSEGASSPPVSSTLEIARLGGAFDALVRRLLEALARARANSAHIAHELRTPLTSILAEVDALKHQEDPAVARIRGDVARLADVIEAILVLSDPRAPSPSGAIVNVADLARELAPEGARVEAPDEALVEADERLVALALRNLIDNARKYGRGVQSVRVSRDGQQLRLAVRDGGPGLDARAREQMFDRYWRGAADGEGRGLGLAFVRAVAERYGGRAEAEAGPEGRGLDVSLTLGGVVGWHEEAAPR